MKRPQYRIRETEQGFVAEIRQETAFSHVWKPFITYNGSDDAYPFSSLMNAENALLMEIKKYHIAHVDLNPNSNK